ncbi:Yqey-like protein-domain-containing protein, partial [Mycena vitilis]
MSAFRLQRPVLQLSRLYSVVPAQPAPDLRGQLTAAVKSAMKGKDSRRATTLRAVLAEVYSADKAANNQQVNSSAILSIVRKAAARRTEAAAQFTAAARPELAENELFEVDLLSQFLPPLLSEAQVELHLKEILADIRKDNASPKPGNIFKVFYSVVDKSTVDSDMVKRRLDVLL